MQPSKKPRHLLPAEPSRQPDGAPPSFPKHKRASVKAACGGCRRRKFKCDGERPSCGPCRVKSMECRYPVPEGMTVRDAQKDQLERVIEANSQIRAVLEILRRLPEQDAQHTLTRIRQAPVMESAISMISDAALLLTYIPSNDASPSQATLPAVINSLSIDILGPVLPVSFWSNVCRDDRYLTHLITLFWTWDNTLTQIVDRTTFLEGLSSRPGQASRSTSEERFCSEFLVNSMLAVGFIYSATDTQGINFTPHGRHFADEALRIFELEKDRPSLTQLQGLAMLWVFALTFDHQDLSSQLLAELLRVHPVLQIYEAEVQAQTIHTEGSGVDGRWQTVSSISWGFYCLGAKIGIAFSQPMRIQKPRIARLSEGWRAPPSPDPDQDYLWSPYPANSPAHLSFSREIFSATCSLAELADNVLTLVGPDESGNTHTSNYGQLKALYSQLLEWRSVLPERYQGTARCLPSFVSLCVTFDMILLKLLEPFSYLPFPSFGGQPSASLRTLRGTSIMSNIWAYRAAYGLRHDYWLMQGCFAAAKAVLGDMELGSVQVDTFVKACKVLFEIGGQLPLANLLLVAIKKLLASQNVQVPSAANSVFSGLNARTGKTVVRGVRLVLLDDPETGDEPSGVGQDVDSTYDVTFTDLVTDINKLDMDQSSP